MYRAIFCLLSGLLLAGCHSPPPSPPAALPEIPSVISPPAIFTLRSPDGFTCADIVPEFGGIVSSLFLPSGNGGNRETLFRHEHFWTRDTSETRGGIPLLFPICGRLECAGEIGRYDLDATPRHLPIHGFAMRMPWEVLETTPSTILLRLRSTPDTLAAYPFPFELLLRHTVTDGALTLSLTIRNTGPSAMPFSAGFHPYFLTPPPACGKAQTLFSLRNILHRLPYNPSHTAITGSPLPPPAFPLSAADPTLNDLLLVTDSPSEASLLLPDGDLLRLTCPDEPSPPPLLHRQIYTLPDAPFLCIEPWMTPPSSLNHIPDCPSLLPGAETTLTFRIEGGYVSPDGPTDAPPDRSTLP